MPLFPPEEAQTRLKCSGKSSLLRQHLNFVEIASNYVRVRCHSTFTPHNTFALPTHRIPDERPYRLIQFTNLIRKQFHPESIKDDR